MTLRPDVTVCGSCFAPDAYRPMPARQPMIFARKVKPGVPVALGEVTTSSTKTLRCDARLFGAALPLGKLIMVSGEPGCGKTTSLFTACDSVVLAGGRALYVTAEENLEALKRKADAWNLSPSIQVAEAKTLQQALHAVKASRADFFVIDSLNALSTDRNVNYDLVQITEAFGARVRKARNVGVIVAHINKDGDVSGPETVEHAVDHVVFIEVEKAAKPKKGEPLPSVAEQAKLRRIVRVKKCRYGSDGLAGYYALSESGILWLESRIGR